MLQQEQEQDKKNQNAQSQSDRKDEGGERQGQAAQEGMDEEEARRILDALKDRDKQAQQHRLKGRKGRAEKDW